MTSFADVMREQVARNQFVLFGDTMHHEPRIPNQLANPAGMKEAASGGVKHLFMEMVSDFDPHLRAYHEGKIDDKTLLDRLIAYNANMTQTTQGYAQPPTPEEVAQHGPMAQAMFNLIKEAKTNGIAVHAMDKAELGQAEIAAFNRAQIAVYPERERFLMSELKKVAPEVHEQVVAMSPEQRMLAVQHMSDQMAVSADPSQPNSPAMQMRRIIEPVTKAEGDLYRARAAGDAELAERIKRISGNDKGIILYGNVHGMHQGDLDDHLGQNRTARILLVTDEGNRHHLKPVENPNSGMKVDSKPPAGAYFIDEQKYEATAITPKGMFNQLGAAPVATAPVVEVVAEAPVAEAPSSVRPRAIKPMSMGSMG